MKRDQGIPRGLWNRSGPARGSVERPGLEGASWAGKEPAWAGEVAQQKTHEGPGPASTT